MMEILNRKLVPIHNDWSSGGKGCQALRISVTIQLGPEVIVKEPLLVIYSVIIEMIGFFKWNSLYILP